MTKTTLQDTGERMVPEYHKGTLIYGEHMVRYMSAEKFIENKVVLDIASGSGYGTQILARNAKKVFGVDNNTSAIAYARQKYASPNIEYILGDGQKIPLSSNSVDVVISFETIEHIKDYRKFIQEVKRVVKKDGVFIISTPNDIEFAEGNHFHLHEFTYEELHSILKMEFSHIDSYYQGTWKFVNLSTEKEMKTLGSIKFNLINFAPLQPSQYLYFFLVCSNNPITQKITATGALSAHYSDKQEQILYSEKEKLKTELDESLKLTQRMNAQLAEKGQVLQNLQQEINAIKSSQAYKLALKARHIKSKFTHK